MIKPEGEAKWREGLRWSVSLGLILFIYKVVDKYSLIRVIGESLPPDQAGLLAGILLGDKSGLEKGFYEELKKSGLVHLVIASGSNVMLLSRVVIENLAGWLGRKRAVVVGLAVMWGYGGMVEWEAPIVRSVLLMSILYFAQLWGRKFDIVRGALLAAGVMVAADWRMIYSLSFWLSFVAFGAVVSWEKVREKLELRLSGRWRRRLEKGWVGDFLLAGWVGLWISPILAVEIGRVSLIAPLSNSAVVFSIETISLVGGGGALVGLWWREGGRLILMTIWPLLTYFREVAELTAQSSLAAVAVGINRITAAGCYLVMLAAVRRWLEGEGGRE